MLNWIKRASRATLAPAESAKGLSAAELRSEGNAWLDKGNLASAELCYRQAVAGAASDVLALINLAFVLQEQQRFEESGHYSLQATELAPDSLDAHFILANSQANQGNSIDAIKSLRHTLTIKPDFEPAFGVLCRVLVEQGLLDEAREVIRQALALNPPAGEFLSYLGNIELAAGNREAAILSYRQAVALQPDVAEFHSNLGMALEGPQALECFRRALQVDSANLVARSNMLSKLSFDGSCSPAQYRSEATQYGERAGAVAKPFSDWPAADSGPRDRPLRVGLVSGDLKSHPVGYFIEAICAHLSRYRVALVAYSTDAQADGLTDRIRPHFALWRSLVGLSDETAAKLIREDGIQILIDMAGHTAYNRLPVFSWRPAPLQLSWLGYWATTGLRAIDYVLADDRCLPPQDEDQFIEKVWRLPHTRYCFTPPSPSPDVSVLPALTAGFLTFGSFQRLEKISDETIEHWAAVLHAVPCSRFRLQSRSLDYPFEQHRLLARFLAAGVSTDRISLHGEMPRMEYLAAHKHVDVILDTYPYTGGTTTCEALWMGVPTVTFEGQTMLTRQGASIMGTLGLHPWVARDAKSFVEIATRQTADLERLNELRIALRARMKSAPLCDAPRFAADFAHALHHLATLHATPANVVQTGIPC